MRLLTDAKGLDVFIREQSKTASTIMKHARKLQAWQEYMWELREAKHSSVLTERKARYECWPVSFSLSTDGTSLDAKLSELGYVTTDYPIGFVQDWHTAFNQSKPLTERGEGLSGRLYSCAHDHLSLEQLPSEAR
jgi:hypothetical protein